MRIPNIDKLTLELIKQFGLKLKPFENNPHAYFVADKRIEYNRYTKNSNEDNLLQYIYTKFNIENPEEMKASAQLMAEALREPLQDFGKLPWKDFLFKYDKYSLKHWLSEYANVSEAAITMGNVFHNIEFWMEVGLVCNTNIARQKLN